MFLCIVFIALTSLILVITDSSVRSSKLCFTLFVVRNTMNAVSFRCF